MKVINLETGHEFEWTKETFLNRLYLMKEMYQNYESEDTWEVPLVRPMEKGVPRRGDFMFNGLLLAPFLSRTPFLPQLLNSPTQLDPNWN